MSILSDAKKSLRMGMQYFFRYQLLLNDPCCNLDLKLNLCAQYTYKLVFENKLKGQAKDNQNDTVNCISCSIIKIVKAKLLVIASTMVF